MSPDKGPPPLPRDPLPYRPPEQFRGDYLSGLDPLEYRPSLLSLGVAVPFWIFGLVLVGFMFFALPKFEQIFKDFKTELPGVTKAVLAFGRWTTNHYGWTVIIPILAGIPLVVTSFAQIGVGSPDRYRTRLRYARLLMFLIIFGSILLFVLAMFMPLVAMIESLTGPGSKK